MSYSGTAVILIDPYNDYIHPDGKLYDVCKESLEATNTVAHMKELVRAARANNIPIFYGLHAQYKEGNFDGWDRMGPFHKMLKAKRVCEEGNWGAKIYEGLEPDLKNGDVVCGRHWNANSFANTDLDYQLRQHNITKVICAGMTSNQCLERTSRHAIELGYDVTMLTDVTAGFTIEQKDVAVKLIWPILVEKLMTVGEWAATLEKKT